MLCAITVHAMGDKPKKEEAVMSEQKGILTIKCPAFKDQGYIPSKYTCQGQDINPHLIFENVPEGTKSLVLIMDDPDAPIGTWDHWIVFNIPPEIREIKENEVPKGSVLGTNSSKNLEYGGPCPPPGKPHRYFFKLYALDTILNLEQGARKKDVENAMQGHILDQTSLVGLYKR
jgi:Raf kinase inhibitor-like YbhB/YbcL family protein